MWPKAITPDYFMKKHGGKIPPGVDRCVVPAAPDAWITALEHFGTMSFGDVASYGIRFARDGFPMHPMMSEFIKKNEETYRRWPGEQQGVPAEGAPAGSRERCSGSRISAGRCSTWRTRRRRPRARAGRPGLKAARDAFYRGDIARAITKFIEKEGGPMRFEDFADFRVKFEPTVRARFNDIELHACGPWSQGPVLPMALNILKGYDLKAMGHNSPRVHARGDRGAQARLRRPPPPFRRSELHQSADQGAAVGALRRSTAAR